MGYEHKIITDNLPPKNTLETIADKINQKNIFHVSSVDDEVICCVYKDQIDNQEILKWGGNFIVSKKGNNLFLTVNSGNRKQITQELVTIFKEMGVGITLEYLEYS